MNRLAIEVKTVTTAYLEAKDRDRISRSHKSKKQGLKVSHAKKTKKMKIFYTFLFSRNINIKYVN